MVMHWDRDSANKHRKALHTQSQPQGKEDLGRLGKAVCLRDLVILKDLGFDLGLLLGLGFHFHR